MGPIYIGILRGGGGGFWAEIRGGGGIRVQVHGKFHIDLLTSKTKQKTSGGGGGGGVNSLFHLGLGLDSDMMSVMNSYG